MEPQIPPKSLQVSKVKEKRVNYSNSLWGEKNSENNVLTKPLNYQKTENLKLLINTNKNSIVKEMKYK